MDTSELVAGDILASLEDVEDEIRDVADALATQYFRAGEDPTMRAQFVLPGEAFS
jgi:hypothetical protein